MKWKLGMNRKTVRKWGLPLLFVAVGALVALICANDGPAPQELSLRELAEKGPGDNPHVVLSSFLITSYVYQEEDGVRHQVWMPAVPRNSEYHQKILSLVDEDGQPKKQIPLPDDIRVLVKKVENVSDEEPTELGEQKTIRGTIVNETAPLGKDEKKLLAQSYPGIDFDRCWILQVEEQAGALSFFRVLGIFLLLGGVAWTAWTAWTTWPGLQDLVRRRVKEDSSAVPVAAGGAEQSERSRG